MTFSQELNLSPGAPDPPFIPGHIGGYVALESFSNSVPESYSLFQPFAILRWTMMLISILLGVLRPLYE